MLNRLIAKGASGYMRKQVSQCQKRLEGCWGGGGEGGPGREGGRVGGIALGKAIGTRIGWLYGFYYL